MTEISKIEARLMDVEIKISYSEDTVDELNRAIFRQQQQIDQLIKQIKTLSEQVQNAVPPEQQRNLCDEIPPHY
jgi:SlyX protein